MLGVWYSKARTMYEVHSANCLHRVCGDDSRRIKPLSFSWFHCLHRVVCANDGAVVYSIIIHRIFHIDIIRKVKVCAFYPPPQNLLLTWTIWCCLLRNTHKQHPNSHGQWSHATSYTQKFSNDTQLHNKAIPSPNQLIHILPTNVPFDPSFSRNTGHLYVYSSLYKPFIPTHLNSPNTNLSKPWPNCIELL